MQHDLTNIYRDYCLLYLDKVQITNIKLPTEYDKELQKTAQEMQKVLTINQTKTNVEIDQQTKVKNANISREQIINQAAGETNQFVSISLAKAERYLKVTKSQTAAYKEMKTSLGFTEDSLLKYIKAQTISKYPSDKLILSTNYNLAKPVVTSRR